MFANALLILPDFATILLGLLLARVWRDGYDRGFWAGAERLVYYVLFPALLFASINSAQFSIAAELKMLGAAVGAFAVAVALAFAAQPLLKPAPDVFAACVQTGFRYNSYIGLALAQSLAGSRGVPLANLFAVYALARQRELHLGRELIRNPLILSTVAGLVTNLLDWQLPAVAASFAQRLGSASLALGLLCIGAGLTLRAAQASPTVLGYFIAVKLAVFPAVAWALAQWLGLTGTAAQVVLLFAALPTASSAYVLAARMGGNAAPVAFIVTAQTLLAMVTLPLWMLLAPRA